jgi:hypothetical protein
MKLGQKMEDTVFVERHNGTDRHRNARKARKTYRFSKDWEVHEAMSYFTLYNYNFCWPVRTLRVRDDRGDWRPRSPAIAAGLADHVWSMAEWFTMPAAVGSNVTRCVSMLARYQGDVTSVRLRGTALTPDRSSARAGV